MVKYTHGILVVTLLIILTTSTYAAVIVQGSQEIKPGDDWRQSVTLSNERSNEFLEGDFISDNGWCKWDNGLTVKHLKLMPRETRTEVLIIKVPIDVKLDKDICIISFEGDFRYKTEIYIIGGIMLVVVSVVLWLIIRWARKRKGQKKNGYAWLEEALH